MLGTFVEICAFATKEASERQRALVPAIEQAFARLERIQSLMSAHDPASELSELNRDAARRAVKISAETFEVLNHGLSLARESCGAFDFTIAPTLASWGLLPPELKRSSPGNWRAVRLLKGRRVRFDQPLAIDLGGIAKGYAVDQAVAVLQDAGVDSGWVNAGGDLRTFGDRPLEVGIRHPVTGGPMSGPMRLQNEAMATSSPTFSQQRWKNKIISHLVNPHLGRAIAGPIGVTVRTTECWLADALTKIVMNFTNSKRIEQILDRHHATALVFTA